MKQDFSRSLVRSAGYLLVLVTELVLLRLFHAERPLYIPPYPNIFSWCGVVIAAGFCWVFSHIYSHFTPGGYRTRVAGWLGICWALPITLPLFFCSPELLHGSTAERIMQHLTWPLLCILPTWLFSATEQAPTPPAIKPLRKRRQLLYAGVSVGALCLLLHIAPEPPKLSDSELAQKLRIKGEYIRETDDFYVVKLEFTNHTEQPIMLGNTEQSLTTETLHNVTISNTPNSSPAHLTGFPIIYTQTIEPRFNSQITLLYRKTEHTAEPDKIQLSFTYLRIGERTFSPRVYTLQGDIEKTFH